MKGKIFVTYHDRFELFENEILVPIQTGESLSKVDLNILKDNTGINISNKNYKYSEYSAIYYMWKNLDLNYYGLFHYRRLFILLKEHNFNLDFINRHHIDGIYGEYEKYGLNENNVRCLLRKYDILMGKPVGLGSSIIEQFKNSKDHHIEHLMKAFDIACDLYPEYLPYKDKVLNGDIGYFTNTFVMKKSAFNEYCEWIFSILNKVDEFFDFKGNNWYEKRYLGYIAERLNTLYVIANVERNKYSFCFLDQLFISNNSRHINELKSKENSIFIFGAGNFGLNVFKKLLNNDIKVKGFIDNDISKQGNILNGIRIFSPKEILEEINPSIVVASDYSKQILEQLKDMGVKESEIFVFDYTESNN